MGPGIKKQEKRKRVHEEEMKVKLMKNSDIPSLSVERMRKAQARLKTPLILVLSGHVKPCQTSDPRSGFAAIKKDLPAGLTPVHGDKKVKHLLGIKRRPETQNMAHLKSISTSLSSGQNMPSNEIMKKEVFDLSGVDSCCLNDAKEVLSDLFRTMDDKGCH